MQKKCNYMQKIAFHMQYKTLNMQNSKFYLL